MQVLLRAAFHLSALRDSEAHVAIVVDRETELRVDQVVSLLRPWRSWLDVTSVVVTDNSVGNAWLDAAVASGAAAVSIISERLEFAEAWGDAAGARGLQTLASGYETESGRRTALLHEMSHHHFEMGGFNEWDGKAAQYSPFILQQISAANCIRHFPRYMMDELRACRALKGQPIDALDVGCGPISHLRWGALDGVLHVTGVDPLLDIYDLLLVHHGLDGLPSIRVDRAITAGAERLDDYVAAGSIDFAYCCNALDHVEDPLAVVAALGRALRPGACLALEFATREGSRQEWRQLHQFDLFVSDERGTLMCQWQDGRLRALIPDGTPLRLERVETATDDYTAVVLRHTGRRSRWREARAVISRGR